MHSTRVSFLALSILLTVVVACGGGGGGAADPELYEDLDASMVIDGTTVNYTLAIPRSYSDDVPAPLVLALHFGGEPSSDYGGQFMNLLVKPALRELEALILAPTVPDEGGWTAPSNESIVLGLVDEIRSRYRVDPDRILVTGFSLGGIGAWAYATNHPDLFSAAIPVAAPPTSEAAEALSGVPVYAIHSRDDGLFDWQIIEDVVQRLQARGVDAELRLVEGVTHFETKRFVGPLRGALSWLEARWGPLPGG